MILGRLLAAGTIVLAVAACSGGSDDDAVAEALADDLRSAEAFADDISEDEARCVGDAIVDALGVDDARTVGRDEPDPDDDLDDQPFVVEALTDDDIDAIGSAMETCVRDIDAIVVDLVAAGILETPSDEFPVSEEEAGCVGEAVAGELTFSRLLQIGLEGGDELGQLSDDEAIAFGAAFSDCVDVRTILLDQVAASGADADVVACLDEQISDDAIEALFIASFAGDGASAEGAFAGAIEACT